MGCSRVFRLLQKYASRVSASDWCKTEAMFLKFRWNTLAKLHFTDWNLPFFKLNTTLCKCKNLFATGFFPPKVPYFHFLFQFKVYRIEPTVVHRQLPQKPLLCCTLPVARCYMEQTGSRGQRRADGSSKYRVLNDCKCCWVAFKMSRLTLRFE